jgi:hypothetical protein
LTSTKCKFGKIYFALRAFADVPGFFAGGFPATAVPLLCAPAAAAECFTGALFVLFTVGAPVFFVVGAGADFLVLFFADEVLWGGAPAAALVA